MECRSGGAIRGAGFTQAARAEAEAAAMGAMLVDLETLYPDLRRTLEKI